MGAPQNDKSGVRQTYRALVTAGYSIVVMDGAGEEFANLTETNAIDEVMSCDDGYFIAFTPEGDRVGFVWFVYGNDPSEVICDYSMTLEHVLGPLTENWF